MSRALDVVNKDLMTEKQNDYVMGILGLIMDADKSNRSNLVRFPLFCVLAALSERIVALEATVARCINKLDLTALKTKLMKARDMFLVNDSDGKGVITLDALRIELRAGRISEVHENEAIAELEEEGLDELNFMDFLVRVLCFVRCVPESVQVYLPLFIDIHEDILNNPLEMDRKR